MKQGRSPVLHSLGDAIATVLVDAAMAVTALDAALEPNDTNQRYCAWINDGFWCGPLPFKDCVMPKYLVEGRYTSDGLKGLAREASSRRRVDIAKTIESAGGKLEVFYFAFGDADFYIIFDVPDNISAAALSVVANQSRFVTSKIIVLMTADEMDQAIKKSMTIEFLPPGH
jgi:uncharacterized protein with GYD domain